MRRLPFNVRKQPTITGANICPFVKFSKHLIRSRASDTRSIAASIGRRRRSVLLPRLPLLPILPPIVPKLPLLPLPILPMPLRKLKKSLKPLKVPILDKRSVLSKSTYSKQKPIKIPSLDIKAGKRRILDHLLKLRRKGSLTTKEFLRFRKLLLW